MATIEIFFPEGDIAFARSVLDRTINGPWAVKDKVRMRAILADIITAHDEQHYIPKVGDRIDVKERGESWSERERDDVLVVGLDTEDGGSDIVVVRDPWGDYTGYEVDSFDFRLA